MLVLKCDATLDQLTRERLREEVKSRAGEDCIVLDSGIELERIKAKKEQPLWRRLFWCG